MAQFTVGQRVSILETAFSGSPDKHDIEARGKVGYVAHDLAQEFGARWEGCYVVQLDGEDEFYHVTADEIEAN